jgi:hypothetical protein
LWDRPFKDSVQFLFKFIKKLKFLGLMLEFVLTGQGFTVYLKPKASPQMLKAFLRTMFLENALT